MISSWGGERWSIQGKSRSELVLADSSVRSDGTGSELILSIGIKIIGGRDCRRPGSGCCSTDWEGRNSWMKRGGELVMTAVAIIISSRRETSLISRELFA
jgi:hypothetical protein